MDLWDLTRLLFRRWYIALPILLASVLTSFLVGTSVKPDYSAAGHVVMIPAPGPAPKLGEPARNKNPWGDLGFQALGNAAILKVMDQRTLKSLENSGLSDSITVEMDLRSPIFLIEAVGDTPRQATATVQEVIRMLVAEVDAQQKPYNVAPQDTITTRTLTDGSNVEKVTTKVKRVLIVTFGLGLMLTAAGTIGIDALLRWRRRRAAEIAAAGDEPAPDPADPAKRTTTTATADDDPDGERTAIRPRFVLPRLPEDTEQTTRLPLGIGSRPTAGNGTNGSTPAKVTTSKGATAKGTQYDGSQAGRRSGEAGASGEARPEAKTKRPPSTSGDATVVIPLARNQWAAQDDRNGGR